MAETSGVSSGDTSSSYTWTVRASTMRWFN